MRTIIWWKLSVDEKWSFSWLDYLFALLILTFLISLHGHDLIVACSLKKKNRLIAVKISLSQAEGLKLKDTKELLHALGEVQWARSRPVLRVLPMGEGINSIRVADEKYVVVGWSRFLPFPGEEQEQTLLTFW